MLFASRSRHSWLSPITAGEESRLALNRYYKSSIAMHGRLYK
jgi:hypothetical protein